MPKPRPARVGFGTMHQSSLSPELDHFAPLLGFIGEKIEKFVADNYKNELY